MAAPKKSRSFHQELVLHRWMMGFFKNGSLKSLKDALGEDRYEGIDSEGQTLFYYQLARNVFNPERITELELRRYDIHVAQHWKEITERRNLREGHVLQMKYFQYLSLLFTEIYLDWYFNHRQSLLDGLNAELAEYGKEKGAENFQTYEADDLNKIAFWNATGSGKTLLLHVNIRQYLHYFQNGKPDHYPSKIILLTPNEGLSHQHLEELHLSGFSFAQLFNKSQKPTAGTVEIIDINKLGDEMGDKKVAVEAFEGNNLVLVDEGHRGTGTAAGAWMSRREALVRGGFAFEYSATFGQAVAKGMTVAQAEEDLQKKRAKVLFETGSLRKLNEEQLAQLSLSSEEKRRARVTATREIYAKCILFDYSYKFFYEDGYGKESLILNLANDDDVMLRRLYFTACLLSFYQQLWLWNTHRDKLADFNIEKPLWVFVGNKVADDDSDILTVIQFLADFLNDEAQAKSWIADLVADKALLLDAKGRNIFERRFLPLMHCDVGSIYADILKRLFNSDARQRLKLTNIKNSKGELALRVGGADPFGLINIGDDSGFFKLCEAQTSFDNETDDFGGALFNTINRAESKLNVLVGSRKFTEGWSSWRVSTMGLLNMGQGEGSQIIQLFGRGVRLKGKAYSLKRSVPSERPKDLHLEKLETLNIFGVRANYMAQFKEYLKEEGVTTSDEMLELDFPTRANLPAGKLKTLALKDGYKDNQKLGFKRTHFPELYEVPKAFIDSATGKPKIKMPHVVLDMYPRIEAMSTTDKGASTSLTEVRYKGKLPSSFMAMYDFDRIYLALQEYKLQRSWSNLRLDMQRLMDFCYGDNDWYTLYIPQAELRLSGFATIRQHEEMLIQLLMEYTDRFYRALKNAYEGQFYDVIKVNEKHGSMLEKYHFEIEDTDDGRAYQKKLEVLKKLVSDGTIGEASDWNAPHMVAICFDLHLYYPLLSLESKDALPLKMRPLAFDAPSEVTFVRDLETFYQSEVGKELIGARSLYLLRNADREEKGLGFALAGNFYPDFLLWLVDDQTGQQWLSFVDPKGLRNLDLTHPKLGLYKEVKTLEKELNDPSLTLNAFILSATKFKELLNVGDVTTKSELEDRNVLFMEDDGNAYLRKMFARIT
jgi:hypothetical protein